MYLQFHSVKEPSKNRDVWVGVLFGSLRGRVRVYFGFLYIFFYFRVRLAKTCVPVRFFLAGFGFLTISNEK